MPEHLALACEKSFGCGLWRGFLALICWRATLQVGGRYVVRQRFALRRGGAVFQLPQRR
jgi:hypothetical protein